MQEHGTNDTAFEHFVVPEIEVLLRVAHSLTHNHAEAEDLVQDTLLRAYRGVAAFDGQVPPGNGDEPSPPRPLTHPEPTRPHRHCTEEPHVIRTLMMRLMRRKPPGGIDCDAVGELLQSYLDGHVDADQARRIAAHLEDCRRCGMGAATYEQINASLSAHRHEVPAESIERLRGFAEGLIRGEEPDDP